MVSIQLPDHPPHHHSLDSVDLFWPNCLYVGLCLPVPLKIFALICLCFFWAHTASFPLFGLGERVHGPTPMAEECVSARIDHRLHNPPWSILIDLSNVWMCVCVCVCLFERKRGRDRERTWQRSDSAWPGCLCVWQGWVSLWPFSQPITLCF